MKYKVLYNILSNRLLYIHYIKFPIRIRDFPSDFEMFVGLRLDALVGAVSSILPWRRPPPFWPHGGGPTAAVAHIDT